MQINVLLVDDEPSIIQALRRMLRSQDWNLFEANDGEEALDVLRREHIHVMVTDFKMPRRDGISLCHEARKISPYTYRLLLSGQVDYSALREAWHAGDVHRFVRRLGYVHDLRLGRLFVRALLLRLGSIDRFIESQERDAQFIVFILGHRSWR